VFDKIAAENLQLKEAVKDEPLNRAPKPGAKRSGVERVRTVAMGMNDLADIFETFVV
jgi:hypothetical protein